MSVAALAILAAGAVVLIGVVAIVVIVSQRPRDGVDTFRRQIDALSPEARRGVVDQVQSATVRPERIADRTPAAEDDADAAPDDTAPDDPAPDEAAPPEPAPDDDRPDDGSSQRGA